MQRRRLHDHWHHSIRSDPSVRTETRRSLIGGVHFTLLRGRQRSAAVVDDVTSAAVSAPLGCRNVVDVRILVSHRVC